MRPLPLAISILALTACATARTQNDPAAVLGGRLDTTVAEASRTQQLLSTGKIKVAPGGVLVLQLGTGNTANPTTTDNTKQGSRGGASSSGPGSPVTNDSKRGGGGVPWYVCLAVAVGSVVGWELLKPKFAAWWARVG